MLIFMYIFFTILIVSMIDITIQCRIASNGYVIVTLLCQIEFFQIIIEKLIEFKEKRNSGSYC